MVLVTHTLVAELCELRCAYMPTMVAIGGGGGADGAGGDDDDERCWGKGRSRCTSNIGTSLRMRTAADEEETPPLVT